MSSGEFLQRQGAQSPGSMASGFDDEAADLNKREFDLSIQRDKKHIHMPGNFFWVVSGDDYGQVAQVGFSISGLPDNFPVGIGSLVQGREFKDIQFTNSVQSGVSIEVRYGYIPGLEFRVEPFIQPNQQTFRPDVPENMPGLSDVSVNPTSSGQILASNADRENFTITNLQSNAGPIRLADSAVGATSGIQVAVGMTYSESTQSEIHVYNPNSSSVTIARNETVYV